MKRILFFILVVSVFNSWSQELIRNGSFEVLDTCPNTLGQFHPYGWFGTHGSRTSPDLFSTCAKEDAYSNPKSYIINVKAYNGENFVGIVGYNPHNHYREYVSTKLQKPLVKDEVYTFSISVSQPKMALYYINELGAVFTTDSAKPEKLPMELIMKPHLVIKDGDWLKLNDVWDRINLEYKAKGGEQYLHLGCFLSDEQLVYRKYQDRIAFSKETGYKDAYYIFDDVSLQKMQKTLSEEQKPTKTFVFNNINFNTGDFSSSEKEFDQFEELINYLKDNPTTEVLIEGHTDDVGETDDNQELSEERALFVKSFFEYNKVSNKINTVGYGEEKPMVANDSNENRAKNRRVVIHLFEK